MLYSIGPNVAVTKASSLLSDFVFCLRGPICGANICYASRLHVKSLGGRHPGQITPNVAHVSLAYTSTSSLQGFLICCAIPILPTSGPNPIKCCRDVRHINAANAFPTNVSNSRAEL